MNILIGTVLLGGLAAWLWSRLPDDDARRMAWEEAVKLARFILPRIAVALVGAAFFAESMYHAAQPDLPDGSPNPIDGTGASNACLVALLRHLVTCGFELFDVQFRNPHIDRFDCSVFDGDYVTGDVDDAYIQRLSTERSDNAKQQRNAPGRSEAALIDVHNDT